MADDSIYQLIYDNVGILTLDIDTLYPEGLLTDAILDFYLKYIYYQLLPQEQRKKLAICTASYFHENIIEEQLDNEHSDIRIIDKDFVLMPAYYNAHWFLIILCYPGNINADVYDIRQFPRIIILDSSINFLKTHRSTILQKFQSFVQNQIALESGKPANDNELPVNFVPVVQQTNDYDCGLFLLEFAEQFILDNFETSTDWSNYAKDDGIDCDKKRQNIRLLIERLSKQATQHFPD